MNVSFSVVSSSQESSDTLSYSPALTDLCVHGGNQKDVKKSDADQKRETRLWVWLDGGRGVCTAETRNRLCMSLANYCHLFLTEAFPSQLDFSEFQQSVEEDFRDGFVGSRRARVTISWNRPRGMNSSIS